MARYKIGDQTVRRKNFYMPCIISERIKEMSDEEYARILKETYWADFIANAEWAALLEYDDCSPSAKSRLKKKSAGWLIALARIYYLNPRLFAETVEKAAEIYEDQIQDDSFLLQTVRNLADARINAPRGGSVHSEVWTEGKAEES